MVGEVSIISSSSLRPAALTDRAELGEAIGESRAEAEEGFDTSRDAARSLKLE